MKELGLIDKLTFKIWRFKQIFCKHKWLEVWIDVKDFRTGWYSTIMSCQKCGYDARVILRYKTIC